VVALHQRAPQDRDLTVAVCVQNGQ
jgi:hypothetical protein